LGWSNVSIFLTDGVNNDNACVSGDFHPQANLRHYAFLLQGLADVQQKLAMERNCRLIVVKCRNPVDLIVEELAAEAVEIVVDRGYTRVPRLWYRQLAERLVELHRRLTQVESNVVVPIELVSDKSEFGARTIRPKIWQHADKFLIELPTVRLIVDGLQKKSVFEFLTVECQTLICVSD
jgi:deoxyribodipyrimidine photo-lyase